MSKETKENILWAHNDTNTFNDVATDVFEMRRQLKIIVYDNPTNEVFLTSFI